jgi:hypothetical protein
MPIYARTAWFAAISLLLFAAGCGDDGSQTSTTSDAVDTIVETDTAETETALDDTTGKDVPDGNEDTAFDSVSDDTAAPLERFVMTRTRDNQVFPFPVALFGVTIEGTEGNGNERVASLYVETSDAEDGACPVEASPTPGHLLILSGVPLPAPATAVTEASGAKAVLLDFTGDLLVGDDPFLAAARVSLRFDAGLVCADCIGQGPPSQPDGAAKLTVQAEWEDANGAVFLTATGQLTASHCDSLDSED